VRLIVDRLPGKARLVSEVLINLIVLIFLMSGFYTGVQMSIRSWYQMTAVMEISMTLPYLAIPTGCLLMFIQQLNVLVRMLFIRDIRPAALYSGE